MNDCAWAFITNCENNCNGCKYYISANSDKGNKIFESYENDVNEALKPLKEKWRNIKLEQSI